ncbi:DNA polymerase III subunit delta' [Halorhodospira halophila]|uniref:DNA-directed DNA polymerase n=1 Tax=Halorhodospira halophila (strain DSM 244 / SL1) TaxID=349124 RepID=A1WSZ0_HALHL|nr:DNA polymerase III subunit delta' [Halorhodospira halophila]ABM60802.1 DNA polymerase III, delta prime subunit [Halorhodospira halophila SL1]
MSEAAHLSDWITPRDGREQLPPWLLPELDRLLTLHDQGRLHHALLLTGRTGLGKRLLAGVLARALLCQADEGGGARPCGQCRGCHLTGGGSHPDLRTLSPSSRGERGEIVVDSVRGLVDFLHLSAQRGGSRVAVIVPCDRLNRAAANSLLKTLEEPPPGVFLILATGRPGRLPPTVRSRCTVRGLTPPAWDAARRWLAERAGGAEGRVDKALALAGGMPLTAEQILHEQGLEGYESLLQQLHRLSAGGDPVKEAEAWEGAPEALADAVTAILADLLRQRHGAPDRGLLPSPLAQQLVREASVEALHQAFLRIGEHRRGLEQPLNGRLAAEAIFLDLAAALRPARQSAARQA